MNQPGGKIKKILIVEDDKLDQKAMARVFDAHPLYQITIASSIKEAREAIGKETFDMAILDIHLSDGMATEFFPHLGNTPFMVTSGSGTEDLAVQAYKNGAADYLIKDPDHFYLKLLPTTVEKVIKKKELDELKESFISTVSHELRTPLTVISLGLENLQAGILGPLSEKQMAAIERNIRNTKRLGRLIDDLLDLSRLESGRTRFERKEVDLKHLIHEVIQNFQPAGKEGGALIQEEMEANFPHLECDPDLIAQVLTNLLSNAIRYAEKKIAVKAAIIDGAIQISLANDGPGIPAEKLGVLFEKFVQLDRGTGPSSYKGTGLGLAISKEIIEQHKGKIWVENDGKKGVKFYFTLPIQGDRK